MSKADPNYPAVAGDQPPSEAEAYAQQQVGFCGPDTTCTALNAPNRTALCVGCNNAVLLRHWHPDASLSANMVRPLRYVLQRISIPAFL